MSKDIVVKTTFDEDIYAIKDITTKAFVDTGSILLNIQDDEKYKEAGYKTFTEAVECELGFKKSHAYQLMNASLAYHNVSAIAENLPTAETQLRPLIDLEKDQQVEVWQVASKNGVPTAKQVKECRNELFPKPKKARVVKPTVDNSTTITTTNSTTTMVDPFPLETEIAVLKQKIKEQTDLIMELSEKVMMYEAAERSNGMPQNAPQPQPHVPKDSSMRRFDAIAIITKRGNPIQVKALNTKTLSTNKHLYNMLSLIREEMLKTTPPGMIPQDILNCTEVVD